MELNFFKVSTKPHPIEVYHTEAYNEELKHSLYTLILHPAPTRAHRDMTANIVPTRMDTPQKIINPENLPS
jgi:threonine synthase